MRKIAFLILLIVVALAFVQSSVTPVYLWTVAKGFYVAEDGTIKENPVFQHYMANPRYYTLETEFGERVSLASNTQLYMNTHEGSFRYITAGGDVSKIEEAREILLKTVMSLPDGTYAELYLGGAPELTCKVIGIHIVYGENASEVLVAFKDYDGESKMNSVNISNMFIVTGEGWVEMQDVPLQSYWLEPGKIGAIVTPHNTVNIFDLANTPIYEFEPCGEPPVIE